MKLEIFEMHILYLIKAQVLLNKCICTAKFIQYICRDAYQNQECIHGHDVIYSTLTFLF